VTIDEAVSVPESGAATLAFALQVLGLTADANAIHHQSGKTILDEADILRAAKQYPVKVRAISSRFERLATTPRPFIAALKDGSWLVIGKNEETRFLAWDPRVSRSEFLSHEAFRERWTGRIILLSRRAPLGASGTSFGVGWFVSAVRKYRAPLIEVLVASFFVQIFALLTPLFFQVIIDKVLVHRGISTLEVLALGLGILSVFDVTLGGLRTYLLAHTTNRIDVELGARLYSHLMSLPMAYFQWRRVGDTVARARELETVRQFITSSAVTLTIDLFFTTVFIAVLFIYSPLLAMIVIGALPFYVLLSLAVTPTLRAYLNEKFRRNADNQAFLVETVAGVETIKAMAVEPLLQRRWEEQLAGYVTAAFRVTGLGTMASQFAALINKISNVFVLFLGAGLVIDNRLTVGELVAFNMISGQIAAPVLRLAQMWQDFQQARLSIDRLGDIFNSPMEPGYQRQMSLPPMKGNIRLEHVTFRYRFDSHPVLHDISLDIPAGQILGIVGSSGSGKSTLAKLIQRLYLQESGRILIDETDLSLVDPVWLRRQIGVVLQESVLFNRSVRDNIAFAEPGMSMPRVIAAAELAGAHKFITSLPEGYDTVIGERGASLSGGQRQRIAIARALVGDPRILIFDEATSALDYESEAAIQANMRRICQGRTVILIAHRLSTLRVADRIVTIEHGRLIEDGTQAELMRAGGRFAQLWHLQSDGPSPSRSLHGA